MSLIAHTTYPLQVQSGIPAPYANPVGSSLFSQGLCFAQVYTGQQSRSITALIGNTTGLASSVTVWNGPQFDPGGSSAGFDYQPAAMTADLALGAFSIFARVRPAATRTTGGICYRNDGNTVNAGWELLCHDTGTALAFVRASVDYTAATNAVLTAEKWQTVGVAYAGDLTASNLKIYYDGQPQTITTATNGSGAQGSDLTRDLFVGGANFNATLTAGSFKGFIDCVYIWRRVVTREEFILLTANPYLPLMSTVYRPSAPWSSEAVAAPVSTFPGLFFAV